MFLFCFVAGGGSPTHPGDRSSGHTEKDFLPVRDLLLERHSNFEDTRETKRREEISVNLLRLVWEFEEGGELEGGERQ